MRTTTSSSFPFRRSLSFSGFPFCLSMSFSIICPGDPTRSPGTSQVPLDHFRFLPLRGFQVSHLLPVELEYVPLRRIAGFSSTPGPHYIATTRLSRSEARVCTPEGYGDLWHFLLPSIGIRKPASTNFQMILSATTAVVSLIGSSLGVRLHSPSKSCISSLNALPMIPLSARDSTSS